MRAGRLRHCVAIEEEQRTPDGQGGFTHTWAPFAEVYADVQPLRGTERLQAQQLEAATTHKITIRHCPGVTEAMRVNFEGRFFNIRSIINHREIGHFNELMCDEGVAV